MREKNRQPLFKKKKKKKCQQGTSLVVPWLRLHASDARGTDSIPDQGTKIPHAQSVEPCPPKKGFKKD